MSILIRPSLEARLRERAEAEGLSVDAYVERLIRSDEEAHEELEGLAVDGLNSGDSFEVGPGYWDEKHARLDDLLKKNGAR